MIRKLSKRFILLVNLFFAGILLLSYAATWVHPASAVVLSLMALVYPIWLAINAGFVVLWLLMRKVWFLLSLAVIALGWPRPANFFQWSKNTEVETSNTIRLTSFNLRMFNRYDWIAQEGVKNDIIQLFKDENPDILLMQEFYHHDRDQGYNTIQQIVNATSLRYYYHEKPNLLNKVFGIATFSRWPILKSGILCSDKSGKARAVYTDIVKDKDTLRVYNLHLKSIGFGKYDYAFLQDVVGGTSDQQVEGTKNIFEKLTKAYIQRADEALLIRAHMDNCPYPMLVAGDFNETHTTFAYAKLAAGMQDAFREKGRGVGATFMGVGVMPPLRIDYVLSDSHFEVNRFKTHNVHLSDHKPVSVVLGLRR